MIKSSWCWLAAALFAAGVSGNAHAQVFDQDFESGLGPNETVGGSFAINNTNAALNNGSNMMGHPSTYGNEEYSFYEVALDLTAVTGIITLSFEYTAHLENRFDRINVQASTGAIAPPGNLITPTSGLPYEDQGFVRQPLLGQIAYDSEGVLDGGTAVFDLSAFAGSVVNVRIQFGSDGSAVRPGFNLDNLLVTNLPCIVNPVVANANDAGAGSLRQAILDACPGSVITFGPGVSTVTLTSAELLITKDLTITGANTTITRSAAGGTPLFRLFNVTGAATTVVLDSLVISNGFVAGEGGGIFTVGNLTVRDSIVSGNTATESNGGGGISNRGTLLIENSTIANNWSNFVGGGVLQIDGGTATLRNCSLSGNRAQRGGAIGNQSISFSASVTIVNCTLSGNTGIESAALINVSNGAGVSAATSITNSTIVGHIGLVGTLFSGASAGSATLSLRNNIYADNAPPNVIGAFTTLGNNISDDATGGGGPGDLINTNPLLAPLGDYGGPTQTYALLPGSPAINAGTATGAPATDQRGIARPQLGGIDIGAFESRGFALSVVSGTPQSAALDAAFSAPLVVGVTANAGGEPVDGGLVVFAAPATGASAALVTNPASVVGGQASVVATANGTPGSYNVTAATNGASGTPTFALTNVRTIDLGMTLTDNPDPVSAGTQLTYLATLANAGPNDALDVSVTLPLPAGTTYVASTPSAGASCTAPAVGANGSIACTWAGATGVGTPRTVSVIALVDAAVANGTVLSATATSAGTGTDTVPANNSASTTTTVNAEADLSITLTDTPDPVVAGTQLSYTATVTNGGPSDAQDVQFSLPLAAGTSFVSATPSAGGSCTNVSPVTCTWAGATAPMTSRSATIVVLVAPSVLEGTVLNATVTGSSDTTDPVAGNNTLATSTQVIAQADLQIGLTASAPTSELGQTVTFTATSTNLGPSDAQNVVLSVTLSPDFRYGSHMASAGAVCTTPQIGNSGVITCTWAGPTAPGAVRTLAVNAASFTPGTSSIQAATSSDTTDPVPQSNNVASTSVLVGNPVEAIPTLSQWGLVLLSLLVGLIGVAMVRRD